MYQLILIFRTIDFTTLIYKKHTTIREKNIPAKSIL